MTTKISLHLIFQKHKESLKTLTPVRSGNTLTETLKISRTDRFIFYILPVLIGVAATVIIRIPDSQATNLYTVCLSVFVGLFLNLLVMITSVLRPSVKIWDNQTRIELIEQTFYNISYTIVISLLALGTLLLTTLTLFPSGWKINLSFLNPGYWGSLPVNTLYHYIFSFLLYYLLCKIILTLFMVIKRVFSLFRTDIQSYKEEIRRQEKQKMQNREKE